MREIVLDTETTGLDPKSGHRIVEIGCVEIFNKLPTGKRFHKYINPEREMPEEAFRIHGLSTDFLSGHPTFNDVFKEFYDFLEDSPLVIHNAEFDMRFINWELANQNHPIVEMTRAVDTLKIAREKFPGGQNNLDALCRRFNVDNSSRDLHGALLDAQLLAQVYLELSGGAQPNLVIGDDAGEEERILVDRPYREPRTFDIPQEELTTHQEFLSQISDPIWGEE